MSNKTTISALEIQSKLGLSKTQLKKVMAKHNVYHDGSPEMIYPSSEVFMAWKKEKESENRIAQKRQAISEKRKLKRNLKESGQADKYIHDSEFIKLFNISVHEIKAVKKEFGLTQNPLSSESVNEFISDSGYRKVDDFLKSYRATVKAEALAKQELNNKLYISQSDICQFLGIDRYEIKAAIQAGLLTPQDGNKRFLRADIEAMDPKLFKEKLVWERTHSSKSAAKIMGISTSGFFALMKNHKIKPVSSYRGKVSDVQVNLWRYGDFAFLVDSPELSNWGKVTHLVPTASSNYAENDLLVRTEKERVAEGVSVGIRDRSNAPEYVALHLGPTNSGKTYNALENLCEEYLKNPYGTYVYSGPLRMLAFEVYEKLSERFGIENVGFITGEEQINPEAPILATTVEMAPDEGDVLIIDEAHWVVDEDRGHYWTKLLMGGKYNRIHVIAAREAKDNLVPLLEDAWCVESFEYERRTGITYDGMIPLEKVPSKTAVVCFSRRSVYSVAAALQGAGKKVGVLYGALPLYARKEQIKDFTSGKYDVIVTTDVIGHGINLPIDNVVFAETEKYDGKIKRDLYTWEAGQIAGRAGRYGLSDKGRVYTLSGRGWFTKDTELVKLGVAVAGGKIPSDLVVDKPLIAPRFTDLGLYEEDQINLNYALNEWIEKAQEALKDRSVKPSMLETLRTNLESVARAVDCYFDLEDSARALYSNNSGRYSLKRAGQWRMPITSLWQIVSGPFDADSPVLGNAAIWLNDGAKPDSSLMATCFTENVLSADKNDLEELEKASKANSELKMVALMFAEDGKLGTFPVAELAYQEDFLNKRIVALLAESISQSTFNTCETCKKEIVPWFKYCDMCFAYSKKKVLV